MKSVNCFVKKLVQIGKCIVAVSTERLESQFLIITIFLVFIELLTGLN